MVRGWDENGWYGKSNTTYSFQAHNSNILQCCHICIIQIDIKCMELYMRWIEYIDWYVSEWNDSYILGKNNMYGGIIIKYCKVIYGEPTSTWLK